MSAPSVPWSLEQIQKEKRRRAWRADPARWAFERLRVRLWSRQVDIIESVRDHRKTAVASCHEAGKSFTSAVCVCWWIDTAPSAHAFAVTTAPSGNQVRTILWREINKLHAIGGLIGRVNQTEWWVPFLDSITGEKETQAAMGRKPSEYNAHAFQGIHAPMVLVDIDEACGVASPLWTAADSLTGNEDSRQLAVGNPDEPDGQFAKVCAPGSGWNYITISAFDTPNFTGEAVETIVSKQLVSKVWVEEKRREWAPSWRWTEAGDRVEPPPGWKPGLDDTSVHPFWFSKVCGQFPLTTGRSLIPMAWIRQAQTADLTPNDTDPNELGVDVGGGGDPSIIAHRHGPRVRIIESTQTPDTMETVGVIVQCIVRTKATRVKVDYIGLGNGVTHRLKELAEDPQHAIYGVEIEGVNVALPAEDSEQYQNKKAELYWGLRKRFEDGAVDLDEADEDLAAELVELRSRPNSRGQNAIEPKKEAKERGVDSPNRAEAVMLAFAPATISAGALNDVPDEDAPSGLQRRFNIMGRR